MIATKFCLHKGCARRSTRVIGYLVKSRDKVNAGFCDEHSPSVQNVFGKAGCVGVYDKTIRLSPLSKGDNINSNE